MLRHHQGSREGNLEMSTCHNLGGLYGMCGENAVPWKDQGAILEGMEDSVTHPLN